jgi:hypothetical protein
MTMVMDQRISRHWHKVDAVTGRKRLFAFMADKVTELHKTGDADAVMVMSEVRELQAIFCEYLLVKGHTSQALITDTYDKTLVQKLKLGPADIRDPCTGAAFDGQYFHLGCPEVFSRLVVEKAKGVAATGAEVNSFWEWLLCTWDMAHRMELVANDIRVDRKGVDVELMAVPWYS